MARKRYFDNFYEKVFEILVACDIGKGYDCQCDLVFEFEEALSSCKFEYFDYILKFTYVDNVVEDVLLVSFTC